MAVLDPVSPYLAIIDRLISLIQARKTRRREYFEKIVDPLYTQFVPLAQDMLEMFRGAQKVRKNGKNYRLADVKLIRAQRDKFADARARLRALSIACQENLKKKKDDELAAFVGSMANFFMPTVYGGASSLGVTLVRFFEQTGEERNSSAYRSLNPKVLESQPEVFINQAKNHLERSWYEIAGRYMEMKLKHTVD